MIRYPHFDHHPFLAATIIATVATLLVIAVVSMLVAGPGPVADGEVFVPSQSYLSP